VLPTKPCPLAHDAALGAPWLLPSARAEGAAASGGTGVFLPCAAPPTRRGGGTHGGGGPAALLAGAGAPKGARHGSPASSASSLFSLGRGSPAASLAGSPGMDALAPLGCLPPHDAGPAAAGAGVLGYAGQCAGGSSEALDALVAKFFRMPQGGHLAGLSYPTLPRRAAAAVPSA